MSFFHDMAFAYSHSTAYGVAAVVVLALASALGALTGRRALGALGAVALVTSLGLSASFAIIPEGSLYVVGYLLPVLWIEGILIWTVVTWCLVAVVGPRAIVALQGRTGARRHGLVAAGLERSFAPRSAAGLSAGLLMGGMGAVLAAGLTQLGSASSNFGTNWTRDEAQLTASITTFVEDRVPKGSVNVTIENPGANPVETIAVTEGVGCDLLTDGWKPGLRAMSTSFTDLPPRAGSTPIVVRISARRALTDATPVLAADTQGLVPALMDRSPNPGMAFRPDRSDRGS
jgi:hypothetical protein